jgi:hypothetical protein
MQLNQLTARVHHPARRHGGGMVARGTRAATRPHLSSWYLIGLKRDSPVMIAFFEELGRLGFV